MWPGRRYWLWNVRLWLAVALAFVIVDLFTGGIGSYWPGDLYVFTELTELWAIIIVAVWFGLVAGHTVTRFARRPPISRSS